MAEATCFGAAFAAGLAVGFWSNVAQIRELHASHGVDAFSAAMADDARKKATDRWKDAVQRTLGLASL